MTIYQRVYEAETKYPEGMIQSEIDELLAHYPDADRKKIDGSLTGCTCLKSADGEEIIYRHDIYGALHAALDV